MLAVTVVVVLASTGCAGDGDEPPSGDPSSSVATVGEETAAAATTFLDGTWEAQVSRQDFLRYLTDRGVRRADAVAAAAEDHVGTDFSVQFLEGMFNVTGPTGESWHSGDFEVHGDELHLWDDGYREAGIPPFRLLISGDDRELELAVAPGQRRGPDHRPGVPELVAGGALWCAAPWVKVT
ncbi:hypothetical protein GCM10011376_23860 [Nocardioides flavus (ex Wang et al. 2016)]|uniref:Uncharacterized protein n=2 Tax=Nocardioides flavus (ex Wang et al. 2016) TaxID=2058780 RepID=A0ABQ3HM35_9ACTN|nr:hypothetical protein GCM10011376_23860 [Nocardioides flavus (ex Wang et al. 2016)]